MKGSSDRGRPGAPHRAGVTPVGAGIGQGEGAGNVAAPAAPGAGSAPRCRPSPCSCGARADGPKRARSTGGDTVSDRAAVDAAKDGPAPFAVAGPDFGGHEFACQDLRLLRARRRAPWWGPATRDRTGAAALSRRVALSTIWVICDIRSGTPCRRPRAARGPGAVHPGCRGPTRDCLRAFRERGTWP